VLLDSKILDCKIDSIDVKYAQINDINEIYNMTDVVWTLNERRLACLQSAHEKWWVEVYGIASITSLWAGLRSLPMHLKSMHRLVIDEMPCTSTHHSTSSTACGLQCIRLTASLSKISWLSSWDWNGVSLSAK